MTVTPVTELLVAGAWVDISGDVYNRDPVTITRGRANESAAVSPSTCSLTLNNRDGKYSPRNPNSPYFGSIGRNTPIRVSFIHNAVTYRRFTGEVSSWPPRWVLGGGDVWVPIEAAGIIRRLGQGSAPVQSALTRHVTTLPNLARHWPLENSALREGVPDGAMTILALSTVPEFGKRPEFGVDAGPAGTAKSLRLRPTHEITFGHRLISGGWSVQVWVTPGDVALAGVGGLLRVQVLTSTGKVDMQWDHENGNLFLDTYDDDNVITSSDSGNLVEDGPALITVNVRNNGITCTVTVDQLNGSSATLNANGLNREYLNSMWGLFLSNGATFTPDGEAGVDMIVSHIAFGEDVDWDDIETRLSTLAAGRGHAGETAGERIERLCLENGITLQPKGNLADTERMGAQPPARLMDLLAEAAAVDMGILHEPRDVLGLAYRTRASMYDQVT